MSGSIPLRDPAWDGVAAPQTAAFDQQVSLDAAHWLGAVWSAFRDGQAEVLGALRAPQDDPRVGHFLIQSGRRQFVLHVKRVSNASDLALAATVSQRLAASGVPVSRYVQTVDGRAEVACDDLAVTATEYVAARHRSEMVEDASSLGTALALMHGALRDDPDADKVQERNRAVRERLKDVAKRLGSGEDTKLPAEYRAMARKAASRIRPDYEFAGQAQRLHGDLSPGNVLFLPDGSARFCDFENSAFSFWSVAFDLASALLRFCAEPLDDSQGPGPNSATRRQHLIAAYTKAGGAAPSEKILDRAMRNLVDQQIMVRSLYELDTPIRSAGEWFKIARLDRLAGSAEA